jgi:hypothetical protein
MGTVAEDLLESMQFMVDHMEGKTEGKTHVVQVAERELEDVRAGRSTTMSLKEVMKAHGLDD